MRNMEIAAKRGRIKINSGDPIHVVYAPQMEDDGTITLKKVGTENTDEMIKSHYEETTLECILARFAAGDSSALNRYQPIYADLTDAPKTLAAALQTIINSRNAFDALPADVKHDFDNDFNKWLATAGSESWMTAMSPVFADQSKEQPGPIEKEPAKAAPVDAAAAE